MLEIRHTDAILGMEAQNVQTIVDSTPGRQLVRHEDAKLEIESEKPHVLIDQYQCFAESGLKNSADLMDDITSYALQKFNEYLAKTAEDGDRFAKIYIKQDPIPDMVVRDAMPEKEFGMVTMPTSRPKIEVAGYLKIDVIMGKLDITYEPSQLDVQVIPPNIRFYLLQEPSIQFRYLGENVDTNI